MRAVPSLHAADQERRSANHSTHNNHWLEADKTAAEESSQRKRLSPAVVIGIADHKSGKDEEEVDGKVAVIDEVDNGLVARKLESLEYVIPYYEERRPSRRA